MVRYLAMLDGNMQVLSVLQLGINSVEHQACPAIE